MALTSWQAENLDDRQFFCAAIRNYAGELILFGIWAGSVWLLSGYVWWLALILFIPLALLVLVGFIQAVSLLPKAYAAWTTVRFLHKVGSPEEREALLGKQTPKDQSFAFGTALIGAMKGIILVAVVGLVGFELLFKN